MATKLYVGNLSYGIMEQMLRQERGGFRKPSNGRNNNQGRRN